MSEEQDPFTVGRAFFAVEPFQQDTVGPLEFPSLEEYRKKARAELRDRFAMAALTGMLANDVGMDAACDSVAEWAWSAADAMLKARGDE